MASQEFREKLAQPDLITLFKVINIPKAVYEFTNLRFRLRIIRLPDTNLRIWAIGYELFKLFVTETVDSYIRTPVSGIFVKIRPPAICLPMWVRRYINNLLNR